MPHPGGEYLLKILDGHDATALFETHHLDIEKAERLLSRQPVVGEYEIPFRYDFSSYASLRSIALSLFPTPASRRMSSYARVVLFSYVSLAFLLHCLLLACTEWGPALFAAVLASAFVNTVLGGFGHNGVHCLSPEAVLLDWNGLSAYEWIHEHMHSHHMYVNTKHDHDALSMSPFLNWTPFQRPALLASKGKHAIYLISEVAVSLQGTFGHRMRWKPTFDPDAPAWMRGAPFLFLLRAGSHFAIQPPLVAAASFLACVAAAGYFFSYLAHLSHANPFLSDSDPGHEVDFLSHQLENTLDISTPPFLSHASLFLDRQSVHHLFPSVDHTRLLPLRPFLRSPTGMSLSLLHERANWTLDRFQRGARDE
jgi:fatty acid desaturase